jgi:hypothetical protein
MEILLAILLLLVVLIIYLIIQNRKLKQQAITLSKEALFLPKKDVEFIEFTVDMYIKYAKDLDIHSKEQHEFIVNELERIREDKLIPKIKNDNG